MAKSTILYKHLFKIQPAAETGLGLLLVDEVTPVSDKVFPVSRPAVRGCAAHIEIQTDSELVMALRGHVQGGYDLK